MGISLNDGTKNKVTKLSPDKYEGQSKTKTGPLTKKEKEKNKKKQKNVKGQGSNVEGVLRKGKKQSEYSVTPYGAEKDMYRTTVKNPKPPSSKGGSIYGSASGKLEKVKVPKKKKKDVSDFAVKKNMGGAIMKNRGGSFKGVR